MADELAENPFAQRWAEQHASSLQLATKNQPLDQQKLGTQIQQKAKTDTAPSAQQQTQTLPIASLSTLLSKFDVSRIPVSRLRQMRRDPMIAFALFFIQSSILRARWSIKCPDAQVAAFVDNALREIWPNVVMTYMNKLTFGWQAAIKRFGLAIPDWTYVDSQDPNGTEKPVWDQGTVQAVIWKPFVALPPETADPVFDPSTGEFAGINYKPGLMPVAPGGSGLQGQETTYDVLESLWFTNERETVHGALWGYPRVGYAYRFWWSFWFNWGLADRHFEKDADPPTIVRYPTGQQLEGPDGQPISSRAMALLLGDRARSNSTIALPSDVIMDDEGRAKNTFEWSIDFLKGGGNFDVFEKRFAQLQTMILRACMVPEEAFIAKGGTAGYNSTGQLQEAFQSSQITLMQELDMDINRYVIPQIVAANFSDRNVKAIKVTKGFDVEDIQLAKEILVTASNADAAGLDIDFQALLDAVGLPSLSPAQIQAKQQAAAQKAQQALPPPQPAQPGAQGQAGVNAQGLYYDARPSITLDDRWIARHDAEKMFCAELSQFPLLKDPAVQSDALALRRVWVEAISRDFSDAASLLFDYASAGQLTLDESFFDRWQRRVADRAQAVVFQTKRVLMSIMRRSSTVEFDRVGLSDFSWDPAYSERAAAYLQERAAELVTGIADTTREEIRTYLAQLTREGVKPEQMSALVRAHFEFFSGWRADRLVRSEVRNAYNTATLLAAQDQGLDRVQAIDGQYGPPRSDPECIARNGKIFTIAEAFNEQKMEHPNGSLMWRLLSPQQ